MHEVIVPINMNHIDAQIIDPKRDRVVYEGPARSYVSNFMHLWQATLASTVVSRNLIISGAGNIGYFVSYLHTGGSTALNRRGLLVGSSAASSEVGDTDLKARLAADITYSAMAYVNNTLDASNKYFDCLRTVTANADSIDINEISLCCRDVTNANPHLMVRDALPATVELNTDDARIFRYRLHFTSLWPPALAYFYLGFTGTNSAVYDTSGVLRNMNVTSFFGGAAAINDFTMGAQIGSSEVAPAWNAYALANAYTATDFYAAAQVTGAVVEDTPNAYVDTHRDFINISGAAQTVRQYAFYTEASSNYRFMIHAGDLPAPVTVGIDEGIRITYKFSIEH
jgi:hypothetical protein